MRKNSPGLDTMKIKRQQQSLLFAFFSPPSALLHGSMLVLDPLKAFTMKKKKTMKETPELFFTFVLMTFFSFSSFPFFSSFFHGEKILPYPLHCKGFVL